MEFFKNHKKDGLTIIEVVIALAIVSFISLGVLSLQQALMRTTSDAANLLINLRAVNNFVVDVQKELMQDKEPPSEKMSEGGSRLTFMRNNLAKEPFANIKNLFVYLFTVSWEGVAGKAEEQLMYLWYEKPKEEREK